MTAECVAQAGRLLEDFLQHEVLEPAAFDRGQIPLDPVDFLADLHDIEIADSVAVARENDHLAVVQIHDGAGVLEQGGGVGRHEPLAVTHTDDERRSLARRHQAVRLVGRDDRNAVGAVHLTQRSRDGKLEIALVQLSDEVRQHLRVGFGLERVIALLQRRTDGAGVLDDAVVDYRDAAGLIGVRMGVGGCGSAVSRPAGVAQADRSLREVSPQFLLQTGQFAGRLGDRQPAAVQHGQARGIVPPVLQSPETPDDQISSGPEAHVPYDTTHGSPIPLGVQDIPTLTDQRLGVLRCCSLGDDPDDGFGARRPQVHPPARPRQPQPVSGVRRCIRETTL